MHGTARNCRQRALNNFNLKLFMLILNDLRQFSLSIIFQSTLKSTDFILQHPSIFNVLTERTTSKTKGTSSKQ